MAAIDIPRLFRSPLSPLVVLLFLGIAAILSPSLRLFPAAFRPTILVNQPTQEKLKRQPPQAPPLFTATPVSIVDDTKRLIQQSRDVQDRVAWSVRPEGAATFANILLPLAQDENAKALETHILGFYEAVSTDPNLRDASSKAKKLLDDFSIESSMREDLYGLVNAAFTKKEQLDPESRRLLEKTHKDYIRNGLGLPSGSRDRFKKIQERLSELSNEFRKNLNEENTGIWLTPQELDGVPGDVLSILERGVRGENEGRLHLTFEYPSLFPTLKFAKDSQIRERVFIANENKCNQNVPLFQEAVVLRDEAARLLGYPNHAAFRIEDNMAKSTQAVENFLSGLRSRLLNAGLKEIGRLKQLKKEDLESQGEQFDGHYFLWDHRFYNRMMVEKEYTVDQQKISEYFPLQTTVEGMLRIFEELFGLIFVEVTGQERGRISPTGNGDDIVWHEDVQVFSVWDDEDHEDNEAQESGFVGYLYLDLHPREGKYGHSANFKLQPGFTTADGKRRYPATALICNFSKPTPKQPSLLIHAEVVTLFHELGHGIHELVSKTTYSHFHGTNTARDFVEAPSQMLENWCWTPLQLKLLSRHYSTLSGEYLKLWQEQANNSIKAMAPPEKIPDDMVNSLVQTKHVNDALFNLGQVHLSIFDMKIHQLETREDIKDLKLSETYNILRKDIVKIEGPEVLGQGNEWGHGDVTFGHLMGGYDASYYGYLSSLAYSTDIFYTIFRADPMNAKEGRRYRHIVLEKGGSQDEMETLTELLGREPNTGAFYTELGLA